MVVQTQLYPLSISILWLFQGTIRNMVGKNIKRGNGHIGCVYRRRGVQIFSFSKSLRGWKEGPFTLNYWEDLNRRTDLKERTSDPSSYHATRLGIFVYRTHQVSKSCINYQISDTNYIRYQKEGGLLKGIGKFVKNDCKLRVCREDQRFLLDCEKKEKQFYSKISVSWIIEQCFFYSVNKSILHHGDIQIRKLKTSRYYIEKKLLLIAMILIMFIFSSYKLCNDQKNWLCVMALVLQ